MTRPPLWKLTRNPVGRALYDRVSGRGIRFAALELYRRPATESESDPDPDPGPRSESTPDDDRSESTTSRSGDDRSLEVTVRESVDPESLPYRADEANEADLFVLGRDGGAVIGQVFLTRDEAYVHELEATLSIDGVYVHRLYVDPDYRNRGIGSRLLASAIAAVRDRWGPQDLYALIADDNVPSRRLFEGRAFAPESRFRYVRLGPLSGRWRSSPS